MVRLMSDKLSDTVTKAWVRLVRARHAVVSAVEADGKAAGVLSIEWYDVLWDLERHEEGVRPFELEQRLLFAQYNLSRLIDRMVEAGLVTQGRLPRPTSAATCCSSPRPAGRQRKATWPQLRPRDQPPCRRQAERSGDGEAGGAAREADREVVR